jgi:[acyl-carrier-protein] S-malonyltransferase
MTQTARTALVFPGMGPWKFADVGKFMMVNPIARRLRREADDVLGYSLVDAYRNADGGGGGPHGGDPEGSANASGDDYSEAAQVAFLVNCLALAQWAAEEYGIEPVACVGPSFGEKSAVAHAGVLPFAETVRLTVLLSRCEREYFRAEHTDVVTHSFIRTPPERLDELLAELDDAGEWYDLSCRIDHDFFMVSLREPALDGFSRRIRQVGGLPLYTMRPPMHSAAFAPLRRKAEEEVFGGFCFADPRLPIVSTRDGSLITTADGARSMLLDGFVAQVQWPAAVAALRAMDVTRVCVAGPDNLWGRVDCTVRAFDVLPALPRSALRPRRRPRLAGAGPAAAGGTAAAAAPTVAAGARGASR